MITTFFGQDGRRRQAPHPGTDEDGIVVICELVAFFVGLDHFGC